MKRWSLVLTAGSVIALGGALAQSQSVGATGGAQAELPIAVQMYTLRDLGSAPEQFRFAAASGYRNVETVGTHDLSAEEMNALLDETGLAVISSHVDLNTLRTDLESVVAFNEAIGNTTIVMPYLGEGDRPQDAAGWQELGAELGEIGAQLKESGMQLAYHNHDFEMEEIDGELIIDHVLNAADPENLMWQADVAWIDRGGQDPAQLLSDHAGRVISIHAKDNYPEGEGEDEGGFATVGSGRLDWDAVLPAADEAGVQYYIVEHDQPADYQTIADSFEFLSAELPAVLGRSDTDATSETCATYGLLEPHAPANALTEAERADGWELLFDGQSLDAWRGFKQDAMPTTGWDVRGGCLVRAAEGGGDIITKKQYDDFELTLEWRVPTGQPGNSGVFFNVTEEGDAVYETGPEMQILNNAVHPDGHDTRTSAGSNYALNEPSEVTVMPAGMFNTARVLVEGNHVEHWLNGVKVVEYELHSPEWEERVAGSKFADWPYGEADMGHIALQDHGDLVWFRNLKIRPLGAASASAAGAGQSDQTVQDQATRSQAVQSQAGGPVTVARDPRLAAGELPVALQMYSLRTFGSVEGGVFEEQLALAADAGYSWIETVGTHDLNAEAMNALLQKYDLKVASTHVDMDTLRDGLDELIAFSKALGNTNVVMPYAEAEDAAGWQALGAELGEIGARLKGAGMTLAYHNHAHEMEMLDGKRAIDHLLDAADPDDLKLQADLAWVARGGVDPAAFVAAHAGRIVSVHAKDNAPEGEEDQDGWAEVGYGTLDWDAILPAVADAGVPWLVVEHDNPRDHLTVARRSYEFLRDALPVVLGLEPRPGISARIGGALATVEELTQGALASAQAAASAENVEAVKAAVNEVFTAVWGVDADMARSGDADARFLGWNERWRVSDPEHGIVGNGLYAREQLRDLKRRRNTPKAAAEAAERADASLSNVIGWTWLDDGVLYGEKSERPRVDLTYVWDYPVDFWNSTADTGWLFETYAQALNILKTDYEGDTAMAQAHAQALVPLLEKALTGVDANGDGKVAPVRQEGGLDAVMAQAEAAGWTGAQTQAAR